MDKNIVILTTKSGQLAIDTLNDKIIEDFLWKFDEFSNFSFFKKTIVDDLFSCAYEDGTEIKVFKFKKFSNEPNNTIMKYEYEKIQKNLSYQDGRDIEKALNFCRTIFLRSEDFNIVKILNRFIDDIKNRLNSLPKNKAKEMFNHESNILIKGLEEKIDKWKNFEDSDIGGFPYIRLTLNIELDNLKEIDKNDLLKKIKKKTASFKIIRETSLNKDETVLTVDIKTIFNLFIYGDSLHYEKLKRILWKNMEGKYGKELLNCYLFFYIIILNTDLSIQLKEISYFHKKLGLF